MQKGLDACGLVTHPSFTPRISKYSSWRGHSFHVRRFFIAAPFLECLRHDFLNCFALYFSLFDVKLMGEAQAEEDVAKRGRVADAISNAAVRCVVVPAAATVHAVRACSRARRVGLRGG